MNLRKLVTPIHVGDLVRIGNGKVNYLVKVIKDTHAHVSSRESYRWYREPLDRLSLIYL